MTDPTGAPTPAPVDLDVLVLGSGVAGLSAAVRLAAPGSALAAGPGGLSGLGDRLPVDGAPAGSDTSDTSDSSDGSAGSAPGLRVGVLTKAELWRSATRWAQGGVAAVLGGDEDSTDLHLADTLAAGAGLCDSDAVRVLVDEGPFRVQELIAMGAEFDRQPGGALALAREGGHSTARVVHAGGAATGAEVERALVDATRASAAAVLEEWFALDLLVEDGRCHGVRALDDGGRVVEVRARHTILATGGVGQLFSVTTNPAEATGDGLAMALRAGVPVADVEFMQFHPTALHHPAMPRPLLSEALRGHGARLRDAFGERFVEELAPRDVVSRAMADRMQAQGVEHLWLDATELDDFAERFPTITASLTAIGLDPSVDWLPIAPAAHHLSGGVVTDLSGATALPGLWAAGEVACTGVHGANRLASNSLLEGMVFGARLAEAILDGHDGPSPTGVMTALLAGPPEVPGPEVGGEQPDGEQAGGRQAGGLTSRDPQSAAGGAVATGDGAGASGDAVVPGGAWAGDGDGASGGHVDGDVEKSVDRLQRAMFAGAGVVRSAASLAEARAEVESIGQATRAGTPTDRRHGELANLITSAEALLAAATLRTETRGAHARRDFPEASEQWRRRIVHRDGQVGLMPGTVGSEREPRTAR